MLTGTRARTKREETVRGYKYRKLVDRMDRKIIRLLARRCSAVREIGRTKKRSGAPVHDPGREREILSMIDARTGGGEVSAYVREIYACVFKASRRVQENDTGA
jgi:chorismate mutase